MAAEVPEVLIDCHVHLDSYPDSEVAEVLQRGRASGVVAVISAGTTVESSRRSVELSGTFDDLFSGIGIHPMDLRGPVDDHVYHDLRTLATSTDKVVVVSEIGLDFMERAPERELQYQGFREQIRLARDLSLPIVFHSRHSDREVLRVLREERAYEVGGVMHYFQGNDRTAQAVIDLGFYISLARPLTRLPQLQRVAAGLRLESIVLETDAAPQPFKAKRENWTEPRHVRLVAQKLAEIQGVEVAQIEEVTTGNVKRLLGARWGVVGRVVEGRRGPGGDLRAGRSGDDCTDAGVPSPWEGP